MDTEMVDFCYDNNNNYSISDSLNKNSILELLSFDTILAVLSWLSPKELCNLSLVSKEFKLYSENDWIWRQFYFRLEEKFIRLFETPIFPRDLPRQNAKFTYFIEDKLYDQVSQFVGIWSEKWCDVDVINSTRISFDGFNLVVEYTKNKFVAQFKEFDGTNLKFMLTGGDSGWSFLYTLFPIPFHSSMLLQQNGEQSDIGNKNTTDPVKSPSALGLNVLRIHDQQQFKGYFISNLSEYSTSNSNSTNLVTNIADGGVTPQSPIPAIPDFFLQARRKRILAY
eukprot:gene3795-4723_t